MIEYLIFVVAGAVLTGGGFFLGIRYSAKGWIDVIGQLNEHYTQQLLLVLKMPIHLAEDGLGDGEPCLDCGEVHGDEEDPEDDNKAN